MSVLPQKLLVFVHHTVETTTRSGIQRVVVELCRSLLPRIEVDFVKWDFVDGQLRYADRRDISKLFPDNSSVEGLVNPNCHKVSYRFADTIADPQNTWLIFPEIPYLIPGGNEIFARILSQCKEYGVRTSAIFYDLIPFRDDDYASGRNLHVEYMLEMLRCESIVGISEFSAVDLLQFYKDEAGYSGRAYEGLREKITFVSLGEYREDETWGLGADKDPGEDVSKSIVMLGTVEPRKQQTRFLKIFNKLRSREPALDEYRIDIFGSLHPLSSAELHEEIAKNSNIVFHKYSPDEVIGAAMSRAQFSVFPSRSEGFGLPIVESMRYGVPCLTASFGSMAEIGNRGGCLMTDVLSDRAIEDAIIELVRNPERLQTLRDEIESRPKWSWGDYACAYIEALTGLVHPRSEVTSDIAAKVVQAARPASGKPVTFDLGRICWTVHGSQSYLDDPATGAKPGGNGDGTVAIVSSKDLGELRKAGASVLSRIAQADIICFQGTVDEIAFAELFKDAKAGRLLPHERIVLDRSGLGTAALVEALKRTSNTKRYLAWRAEEETGYGRAAAKLKKYLPTPQYELAIIISTYNRAAFTELNLGWLVELTRGLEARVCICVVDNASTDDTMARLEKYRGVANVTLISNSANVGMLGNLHVTSTIAMARHVWTIGDDDFISPGAIERVLSVLKVHPRIPIMSHNFGVYHRFQVSDGDTPERYQGERTPLAPHPAGSGVRPIFEFAGEHDNMFTAIYPLVFRSDIVSACFNYPFTGTPFGDLVESVPTTKIIMESLALCQGYWFAEIGVTGNAHNSWSTHRPRWHLILMPQVIYLGRQCGMQPAKLSDWLNVHLNLFYESIEIATDTGKPIHLTANELQNAEWMFQQRVSIPNSLTRVNSPADPVLTFQDANIRQ